jgi:hypothetical protein
MAALIVPIPLNTQGKGHDKNTFQIPVAAIPLTHLDFQSTKESFSDSVTFPELSENSSNSWSLLAKSNTSYYRPGGKSVKAVILKAAAVEDHGGGTTSKIQG